MAKIPVGSAGAPSDRVRTTRELPSASDVGSFRTVCDFSHMSQDDPIVYPGQPGRSHLHAFFGNTALTAGTTAAKLRSEGNSTCRGGTINRSAYWVPAMIDTADGTPLAPSSAMFYYKQGYVITPSSAIRKLPEGLRIIAGDATNATGSGGPWRYTCLAAGEVKLLQSGTALPVCPAGAVRLQIEVFFPQCWDGTNLDAPDHQSHMSYIVQDPSPPFAKHCPATHPVPLPEITYNIFYPVAASGTSKWRLASDLYSAALPAGYSMHADWFNGWRKDISDAWGGNCVENSKDCHAHLLGDGREMY